MQLSKLAAIALAALLVSAGAAAAMPGNAPDHSGADGHAQAADHRPDDARDDDSGEDGDAEEREDEPDESETGANESDGDDGAESANESDGDMDEHAAEARQRVPAVAHQARPAGAGGPPTDMPSAVPDHVVTIHQLIADFLSGDLDGNLGPAVSDVAPEDGSESAADASG